MPRKLEIIIKAVNRPAKRCPVCGERPAVRHGFATCENTACWLCIVPAMLISQWNRQTWVGLMKDKIAEEMNGQLADARGQAVEQGQRADAEALQAIEWEKWADRLAVVAENRRQRISTLEGNLEVAEKGLKALVQTFEDAQVVPKPRMTLRVLGLNPPLPGGIRSSFRRGRPVLVYCDEV